MKTNSRSSKSRHVERDPLVAELVQMLRRKGVAASFGDQMPRKPSR